MPSLKSRFGTDARAETEGVWMPYGGFRVRIARAVDTNPKYRKALEAAMKPMRRQFSSGALEVGGPEWKAGVTKAYSESIVTEWEDVTEDDETTPMPCTPANVLRMLTEYPDFFREVDLFAASQSPYRLVREEDRKNS